MYKKILSAVNEQINSQVTARYAIHLAKECSAKLYLCFVAEKGLSDDSFNKAEDALKGLFLEAQRLGIDTEIITATGEPVQKIEEITKKEAIDIVFAATRREDVRRKFYKGTVARRLLLRLPCTVAIVRVVHIGRVLPKKILVPLKEGSGNIKEKAYFISKLARVFGSKVFFFHTPRPIKKFFHGEIHLTRGELEKQTPKDVMAFADNVQKEGVSYEIDLVAGMAGKAITIEAFAKRHDLIIMGSSGRSLLGTIIKGNPVEEVLRETPCDLIILKPKI
ncbi:MAG: universal stress protein [Nitrospirae bacterium]|nr:universal stress protein [Nitrospirota bacterium]